MFHIFAEFTEYILVNDINVDARVGGLIFSSLSGPLVIYPVSYFLAKFDKSETKVPFSYAFKLSLYAVAGFILILVAESYSENPTLIEFNLIFPLPQTLYLSQHSMNNALCVHYTSGHGYALAFLMWGTILVIDDFDPGIGSIVTLALFVSGFTLVSVFIVRLEIAAKSKKQLNLAYFTQQIFLSCTLQLVLLGLLTAYPFWNQYKNIFSNFWESGKVLRDPFMIFLWVVNTLTTVMYLIICAIILRYGSAVLLAVVFSCVKPFCLIFIPIILELHFPGPLSWIGFALILIGSFIYFCTPDHQTSYVSAIEKLQKEAERTLTIDLILSDPDIENSIE